MYPSTSTSTSTKNLNIKKDIFQSLQKKVIQELQNEFHYPKQDLMILFEYSGYDIEETKQILQTMNKKMIRALIKQYLDQPGLHSKNDEIIANKLTETMQIINKSNDMIPNIENMIENDDGKPKINYFENMLPEIIHHILDFLDPISLGKSGRVCKIFNIISVHPLIYKKFCLILYSPIPKLPLDSPFEQFIHTVNTASIGEYSPLFVHKVNENFRSVVWTQNLKYYNQSNTYFKQFINFRGVYLYAPRISFIGVYQQKELYTRLGTKDLDQFYDPVHLIEFYRYVRFYPDGYIIHMLTNKKLNKENIVKKINRQNNILNSNINQTNDHILPGEYILKEDRISIRFYSPTITIYDMELKIGGTCVGKFNRLHLINHQMRILGHDTIQSMKSKGHQNKPFKFIRISEFANDIEDTKIRSTTNQSLQ